MRSRSAVNVRLLVLIVWGPYRAVLMSFSIPELGRNSSLGQREIGSVCCPGALLRYYGVFIHYRTVMKSLTPVNVRLLLLTVRGVYCAIIVALIMIES